MVAISVTVLSGRTYQVAVSKDGKNIETQEFAVPVSTNDTTTIVKNFYVNYIDTTSVAGMFALQEHLLRYRQVQAAAGVHHRAEQNRSSAEG